MKKTLEVINQLQKEGLIRDFVIGGAIAAFRYLEPSLTDDLDVYVQLPTTRKAILDFSPIYQRLREIGYFEFEKEGVVIEGWPVQFLPAGNPLEEEAFARAVEDQVDDVKVRVFTAEYLMAIGLQLSRPKDRIRLAQFLESDCYRKDKLNDILQRHKLKQKWNSFLTVVSKDFPDRSPHD